MEDDYAGPKLNGEGNVTIDFMKDLLKHFKDQKRLHKRYAYKVTYCAVIYNNYTMYTFGCIVYSLCKF